MLFLAMLCDQLEEGGTLYAVNTAFNPLAINPARDPIYLLMKEYAECYRTTNRNELRVGAALFGPALKTSEAHKIHQGLLLNPAANRQKFMSQETAKQLIESDETSVGDYFIDNNVEDACARHSFVPAHKGMIPKHVSLLMPCIHRIDQRMRREQNRKQREEERKRKNKRKGR